MIYSLRRVFTWQFLLFVSIHLLEQICLLVSSKVKRSAISSCCSECYQSSPYVGSLTFCCISKQKFKMSIICKLLCSDHTVVTGDNEGYAIIWDVASRKRVFEVYLRFFSYILFLFLSFRFSSDVLGSCIIFFLQWFLTSNTCYGHVV